MLFTAMTGPQPSARAAADPRTVRLALELLERTAGRPSVRTTEKHGGGHEANR